MSVLCCIDLKDIPKFCGGVNAPGLEKYLKLTCGEEVTAIPAATDHKITGNITFRAADPAATPAVTAGQFYTWHTSKDEQEFSSEQDENGLWKTKFKAFIPKLTAEKSNILNSASGGEDKIVLVPDRNGNSRLIGSLSNGCMLKVKEQVSPKNGYVVEGEWESSHSPYFYEGA
jgi:hypothetical protein